MKESSVRDWKKVYLKELKSKVISATPGKEITIESLPVKQRGRPPLLGVKLDMYLQEISVIALNGNLRDRGGWTRY